MKTKKDLHNYQILENMSQELKGLYQTSPEECEKKIKELMVMYPDEPQPQNLLGVIAEKKNDKILAMKHYRAACALAPDYEASRANVDRLVDMEYHGDCYFNNQDIEEMEKKKKSSDFKMIRRRLG